MKIIIIVIQKVASLGARRVNHMRMFSALFGEQKKNVCEQTNPERESENNNNNNNSIITKQLVKILYAMHALADSQVKTGEKRALTHTRTTDETNL